MKKNIKKLTSMMLALVMAFALAAPAFAAPAAEEPAASIRVTLKLVDANGKNIYPAGSSTVRATLPADSTVYDLVNKYFPDVNGKAEPADGSAWNTYGTSSYLQTIWCNGTEYATKGLADAPEKDDEGNALTFVKWNDGVAWRDGYGLLSYGDGSYEYYYAGNAWEYKVLDAKGNPYTTVETTAMNEFTLHAGDQVVLDYAVQTSRWTTTEALSPTFPYLPEGK